MEPPPPPKKKKKPENFAEVIDGETKKLVDNPYKETEIEIEEREIEEREIEIER